VLTLVLCGATTLAAAQVMQNPSQYPSTMPGQTGQPGRPGTMGGEIPNTTGQTNPANTPPVPKVDDATLQRDVQQQLASDPALSSVQVAAHNGKVELTGSVASKDDRKKAKEMAKSVPGVTSVKEHVTVGGGSNGPGYSASPAGSSSQNTAGSISGNTRNSNAGSGNMNSAPDNSNPGATPQQTNPSQTAPENTPQPTPQPDNANPQSTPPPSDTPHANATTPTGGGGARLVNAAYQDNGKPSEAVSSQSPSGDAAKPASNNTDANVPDNSTPVNITLTPATGSPGDNAAVQSQIESALRNEPALTSSHIAVNVTDSAIDLSGTVGSSKDKLSAERIAQSFGVNRKLNDKLNVTGHGHSDLAQDHSAMNNAGTGDSTKPNPPQPH
jgi:osmotically-inducible protein OsmY